MDIIRAIAFDFGTQHIGIAVGNEQLGTAQALKAFNNWTDSPDNYAQLDEVFKEWKPQYIVVGLPAARFDEPHMRSDYGVKAEQGKAGKKSGTYQDPATIIANKARKFGHRLMNRYVLPVYFKDERYTSTSAKEEIFNYQGGYRALVKNKGRIDSTAARLILEGFFELGGRAGDFDMSLPPQLYQKAQQEKQEQSN